MLAPVSAELLPLRILLGLLVGAALAWWLLRRQEVLISRFGVLGLYPNPRLIVAWSGLAGYRVDEIWSTVLLFDLHELAVEALPFSGAMELQELELALRPYLTRLKDRDRQPSRLPMRTQVMLGLGLASLFLALTPLVSYWLLLAGGQTTTDDGLLMSIVLSLFLPLAVLNWSLRFRLAYYGSKGHVQVVHVRSLCQRCHYQAVCWHANLHRKIRWQPGYGAVLPTYEEFSRQYRQKRELLSPEVYQACCQCLLAHLQEQDIYQVELRPLVDK
jgi:hypothetical protein